MILQDVLTLFNVGYGVQATPKSVVSKLDIDSLSITALMNDLEITFGVRLPNVLPLEMTVEGLARHIEGLNARNAK